MDSRASEQLAALARVGALLDDAGVEHWPFGGWAVAFHAGSVARAPDELDLAVWLADAPRIAAILDDDRWRHAPEPDEDGGTGYERDGGRLELTYLVREDGGSVVIPLRDGRAPWPGGHTHETGELEGVRARLVSLGALLEMKSSPRGDPDAAAKDRLDLERLRALSEAASRA